jgi:CO/xanthine dehydrogenase Mo-binding subunit
MKNPVLQTGKIAPRMDAFTKVTGKETFAADCYGDGVLWAGVRRAGIPHARLLHIHAEKARALSGVVAVLTHEDVKGSNRQGVVRKDQPVLVDDKIRHCGDAVVLVVAEDRNLLREAMDLISLDCEVLPGIFDPEAAIEEDALLVHEDSPTGNVLLKGALQAGHVDSAFAECAAVVEACFEVPHQEHAYLETESGWAVLTGENTLEIIVSTQTPFRDRSEVAEALGLDVERIRIIAPYCGGAFGGKDGVTVQSLLALAALQCPGRPVKMWWEREESFIASAKRHPARLYYRLGARPDGALHALEAKVYYDTGPYDHLGGAVMALGLEHAGGPYRIPNTRLEAWAVYTNNPVGGPFRGFGVPQVTAAMEQALDMLARKLALTPLEIRLRNALRQGDKNPLGITVKGSTGLGECLRTLEKDPVWQERRQWKSGAGAFKRRGVGIACVMHGMGYGPVIPDEARAKLELTEKGAFRVYCGVVDMGQGNASTFVQIAGEVLNQGMADMELILPDTAKTLPSGSSSASRTTYTFGNALIKAAHRMKQRILERASSLLSAHGAGEVVLAPGRVIHLSSGKEIPLSEIAHALDADERTVIDHFRAPVADEVPTQDQTLRLHGIPHLTFSYGVHAACVEVDELTGFVEVRRYLSVTDCGAIINPQLVEQQVHGGIAQGCGYALCENYVLDRGITRTPDLATYIIPTAMDLPDMESRTVEPDGGTAPSAMKGVGEVAMDGPLPAIANALADACGIRIFRSPFTAERVLMALKEKRGNK